MSKIRKTINDLAQHMASAIIKMLSEMSINELMALSGGSKTRRHARPSEEYDSSRSRSKSTGKEADKTSGKKPAKKGAKARPAKASSSVKNTAVTASQREALREEFFKELAKHGEEWVKLQVVADKVAKGVAVEVQRKIIGELIASGRVERKGSTRDSRYRIVKIDGSAPAENDGESAAS
jgi:hypothetical protein